jgi:hypothetical protein
MTTRTWNGAVDSFNNPADWSGDVVPMAGDIAVINAGTVTATGALPALLTITMDGTNGPTLALSNASLGAGTSLQANDQAKFVSLTVSGNSANAGAITFSGQAGGEAEILLADGAGETATSFVNTGEISVVGQDAVFVNEGTNPANDIVNNGVISFQSGGTTGRIGIINAPIAGTGTIRLQPNTNVGLGNAVSSGQSIVFEPGSGAAVLSVGDGTEFHGVISGFGSSDKVRLSTTPWTNFTYSLSNGIGTFTFTSSSGAVVGTASFAGNNPQSVFMVTPQANSRLTTITTSVPNQPDQTDTGTTGTGTGTTDTGTTDTGTTGTGTGTTGTGTIGTGTTDTGTTGTGTTGTGTIGTGTTDTGTTGTGTTDTGTTGTGTTDTGTTGTGTTGTGTIGTDTSGTAITPSAVGVYRFFDTKFGTHFFTGSQNEKDTVRATRPDLVQEGNDFGAIGPGVSDPSEVTVYRFFDSVFGTHFFTASAAEKDQVLATRPDLVFEPNSTFLEDSTQQAGDIAVYRLFDSVHGTHFYTGDQNEFAGLTTPGTSLYRADLISEGIAFFAPSGSFT